MYNRSILLLMEMSLCGGPAGAAEPAPAKPNFIFILSDDQRFDTIHALGNPQIQTPRLDQLVERGFVFGNVYCQGAMQAAVCAPSRTMLLTGRSLFHIPPTNSKKFDGPTLAGVFNQAGYATLHCGKKGNSFLPGMEAFQRVLYSHEARPEDRQALQPKIIADAAIDFLKQHKGNRPFFLYLAPHCPHDPRLAPDEFMKLYDPAQIDLPKNFMARHPFDNGELAIRDEKLAPLPRTPEAMKRHLAEYYASISNLDHHVGRIVDALKESGLAERTYVIFTSDQGLAVGGRHGLMGKQNLYEHFKSPLIVVGPGIPHRQSPALVYLYDLFPTVCELAHITPPKEIEGASLVPVMKGAKPRVRDHLFAAYKDCQRMVRDEHWKLLWYPKIDRFQMFDLANDPWEIADLAAKPEHAAKLAELKKRLAEEQKIFGDNKAPSPKMEQ